MLLPVKLKCSVFELNSALQFLHCRLSSFFSSVSPLNMYYRNSLCKCVNKLFDISFISQIIWGIQTQANISVLHTTFLPSNTFYNVCSLTPSLKLFDTLSYESLISLQLFLLLPYTAGSLLPSKMKRNLCGALSPGKSIYRYHGPLTRYVKFRVALALGMPGTFSQPSRVWWSRHASRHVHDARAMMHAGLAN